MKNFNKVNKSKGAFTLAELMIVLVVLGVISAILTPILFHAMPDESAVKFKKTQYVLQKAMEETLNSPIFNTADGLLTSSSTTLFCKTFADQLNTIGQINCIDGNKLTPDANQTVTVRMDNAANFEADIKSIDTKCGDVPANSKIVFTSQDGVAWWGGIHNFEGINDEDAHGIKNQYVVMCFGIPKSKDNYDAYGFGIRNDGRIIMGYKANEKLKETAQSAVDNR